MAIINGQGRVGIRPTSGSGSSYDADALAFFTANIMLTDSAKKTKINQLFLDLKSYNLYGKFYAIYLLNLGSSIKNKFNIINPIDSDSAFRLQFSSGFTYDNIATTPNGSNSFAKTFLTPSTVYTDNTFHLSAYGTTNVTDSRYEIGGWNGDNALVFKYRTGGNAYLGLDSGNYLNSGVSINTNCFLLGNYIGGVSSITRNNTQLVNQSRSFNKSQMPFAIFGSNRSSDYSTLTEFSKLPMSIVTIGKGLTTQEITDLNTCIQTYNS
jgi:hypothetical protein